MIDVQILTTDGGECVGFSVRGHAGYGEAGTDIVCAAVSSAAYLVANTVTEILHADAIAFASEGRMELQMNRRDASMCRDLLAGFKLHLLGLEEQYPENIRVSYLEV